MGINRPNDERHVAAMKEGINLITRSPAMSEMAKYNYIFTQLWGTLNTSQCGVFTRTSFFLNPQEIKEVNDLSTHENHIFLCVLTGEKKSDSEALGITCVSKLWPVDEQPPALDERGHVLKNVFTYN